jgi:hypothetical protein
MAIDPAILGRYFGGVGPAPVAPPPEAVTKPTQASPANVIPGYLGINSPTIAQPPAPAKTSTVVQPDVKQPTFSTTGGAIIPNNPPVVTPTVPNSGDGKQSDAFAALIDLFTSYGLGDLSGTITDLMTAGESSSGALVKLKYSKEINPKTQLPYNAAYTARFAGNASRVSKGLNALTEAQYISNEDAYAETLRAYGLGNMLSTDRTANQKKFADYIANDVSSTEFANRIKTASDSVINADPQVMKTFQQYYGGLTTSDLVSYFLAPDETLPMLQQKVSASEIGTAAQEQGLGTTDKARSEYLAKMGVNQAGGMSAISGYQNIADVLPTGQKLSSIYKEAGINYDQTTAENEYLLQNANAATKRKQLASLERAKFSGDAGINPQASNLASARTVQGKF